MLVKNKDFSYYDAHFHYSNCLDFEFLHNYFGASCAHSIQEWNKQEKSPDNILKLFGLHPQACVYDKDFIKEQAFFLQDLCSRNKIIAIGEAGFDYFTYEFKNKCEVQEELWNICLDLALKYSKPLVIHCRKANHKLFEYSKKLNKLPAVLFHSFMGQPSQAFSLLEHNINGYFSFGKQMLNNNKKIISCIKELPLENLLCETDAPYQFLKGEKMTSINEIAKIYEQFMLLKNYNSIELQENCFVQLKNNFNNLFLLEKPL